MLTQQICTNNLLGENNQSKVGDWSVAIKKPLLGVLITVLAFSVSLIGTAGNFVTAQNGTSVQGEIWSDTTWTYANSPYNITKQVTIEPNVTLTIEPGVTVISSVNYGDAYWAFIVRGTLIAHGTQNKPITFLGDGTGYVTNLFFAANNGSSVDLDYCIIKSAQTIWENAEAVHGLLNLTHSEMTDIYVGIYLWQPWQDSYVTNNVFEDSAGISVNNGNIANVYVENNLFEGKPAGSFYDLLPLISLSSGNGAGVIVLRYNSFESTKSKVISAPNGTNVSQNYWGTTDVSVISKMISSSSVSFLPILEVPDPNTPTGHFLNSIPPPTATPAPISSPTLTPSPNPTSSVTPSPSVPEFPTWTALVAALAVTALTAIVFVRRKR